KSECADNAQRAQRGDLVSQSTAGIPTQYEGNETDDAAGGVQRQDVLVRPAPNRRSGRRERDRDPGRRRYEALYPLSYTPHSLVDAAGFEPATSLFEKK